MKRFLTLVAVLTLTAMATVSNAQNFKFGHIDSGQLLQQMPEREQARAQLEKYAKQNIPEAVLNYAIYLDNAGEAAKATQYYENYVSMTSSRKSEDVRRMLLTKQRVWGSSKE